MREQVPLYETSSEALDLGQGPAHDWLRMLVGSGPLGVVNVWAKQVLVTCRIPHEDWHGKTALFYSLCCLVCFRALSEKTCVHKTLADYGGALCCSIRQGRSRRIVASSAQWSGCLGGIESAQHRGQTRVERQQISVNHPLGCPFFSLY